MVLFGPLQIYIINIKEKTLSTVTVLYDVDSYPLGYQYFGMM
jgi:hypothetical protein